MTRRRRQKAGACALLCLAAAAAANAREADLNLAFCCKADNDLYRALAAGANGPPRFATPAEAVAKAPAGAGVLVLADGYPDQAIAVPQAVWAAAADKKLRLFVEYPASLPGLRVGKPQRAQWQRGVVVSDAFGPALGKMRLVVIHDCRFVPVEAADRPLHLVLARVAGYDTAVYGLGSEGVWPLLFEHSGNVLVATTKLSQFVTARYAPREAWRAVWRMVLAWLCPRAKVPDLQWTPTVRPTYARGQKLPPDAERRAFARGAGWFLKSGLVIHESWAAKAKPLTARYHSLADAPPASSPLGDGRFGILESFNSTIRHDGSQAVCYELRNDCNLESAMGLSFGAAAGADARAADIAGNVLDFVYFRSLLAGGPRNEARSPEFGLHTWNLSNGLAGVYYGDDNARGILATAAAAALLKTDRYDERLLRCILANFRTAGQNGFRGGCITGQDLRARGWRAFFDAKGVNVHPHYECYLWPCYLWAYRHTGYKPLLERARRAIELTMAAYPDGWQWTNGFQQERARMLLPLAWLVRVEDTPRHRRWLKRAAQDMLSDQVACGAIREALGPPGRGQLGPPRRNEDFGRHEATLIQQNGNPVADMLYTVNFAFLGLHEAAAATGDPDYARAADRLAEFLVRVQVRSDAHAQLDGAWMRAFDFGRWEHYASSADKEWGPWCVESGWTQGWIVAVLGLRQLRTSLWDLTAGSKIGKHLKALVPVMLPTDAK